MVFSYDQDDLFDSVAMQSSYVSRSVRNDAGEYVGEDLALSHDEDDVYGECFRKCADSLASSFLKTSIDFEVEDGFCIRFRDNGVKDKVLKSIDQGFTDALVYGILSNWFEACSEEKMVEYCDSVQVDKLSKLWNDMFWMRM